MEIMCGQYNLQTLIAQYHEYYYRVDAKSLTKDVSRMYVTRQDD